MKILLKDVTTMQNFVVYHDPTEILIKPHRGIIKVIDPKIITEYRFFHEFMIPVYDERLDLIEYHLTILVDKSTKKEKKVFR